ncbi:MAG TPA: trypsin-like peptidase domain-containing protein [Rhodothermia bacterium]|nr:trypsin-like peptidase domain-containing protein [Rhodothermia bacterium]
MAVDHISLQTTPVRLYKGKDLVSQGTGFYYVRGGNSEHQVLFLVTNFHVLTGSAPAEKKPPIGDSITFEFHRSVDNTSDLKTVQMPLFTKDGQPVWISSTTSPDADMAAILIPLQASIGCQVNCISREWADSGKLKVRPTSTVTLVGYPYGYYDTKNALPIWKTGSVASEPDVDFEGQPLFLVDISAFPGMSGSPAFAISYGMYETEDGSTSVGGARRFLGIYASMQMLKQHRYLEQLNQQNKFGIQTEESLQLGHIWKAKLIIDTIANVDVATYERDVLSRL